MAPVLSVLLLFGGIALIVGFIAVGAHILDGRENARSVRKKRAVQLEKALGQVEALARDTLLVNPSDLTAHQILGVIGQTRRQL